MEPQAPPTILQLHGGQLRIRGWPPGLRRPFGLHASGFDLRGPPRLRRRVLEALTRAQVALVDKVAPLPLPNEALPPLPVPEPAMLASWVDHGGRGIVAGFDEVERHDLVFGAVHRQRAMALVVVRDSGAAFAWTGALRRHCPPGIAEIVTLSEAERTMHWRGSRHDLLVVDRPGQMPAARLAAVLDGSVARFQLGFVDDAEQSGLLDWSALLGPVLAISAPSPGARGVELRLPLSPTERGEHDRAWDLFLCAYDRYVTLRPQAGFAAFIQQARADPSQRDAVHAWHRATRIAAWNASKAAAVAALLERHRGERILVFTPDRASAYALSGAHLIAAVTAELRRPERDAILTDFLAGRLRTLVGPRLLDLGVPEGSADVGILVGGGFGQAQRAARSRRIASAGIVYELVAQDTTEVGRGQRLLRTVAAPSAVDHEIGQ